MQWKPCYYCFFCGGQLCPELRPGLYHGGLVQEAHNIMLDSELSHEAHGPSTLPFRDCDQSALAATFS
jgi:hypothetical protein